MAVTYPPVGFHFKVEVEGLSADGDTRFSEVGGLNVELTAEEVPEGGENRFVQKFPTRSKYSELVLKRGLAVNSDLADWCRTCIESLEIQPKNLTVSLLNEKHEPVLSWYVAKAYPTKWTVSDLNASSNSIAIESIQLFYQYFKVQKP